jgi:hypothetical protein
MKKLALLLLVSLCFGSLGGCVHYGEFRDDARKKGASSQAPARGICDDDPNADLAHKSIWCPKPNPDPKKDRKYYLAFIEVDEFGEMFDRNQLTHALGLIDYAKRQSAAKNAIVVTFIHGWKNNASDSSGNVWGFRDALNDLASSLKTEVKKQQANPNDLRDQDLSPVVGIYIGWRGAVTNLGVAKEFTFFNRRDAATRIPGADLTEILSQIARWTKACLVSAEAPDQCPKDSTGGPGTDSLSVIVGHSFGGLVLERTLTQAITAELLDAEAEGLDRQRRHDDGPGGKLFKLFTDTDLIVMVNEAAPATESKQLMDLLLHHKIELCVDDSAKGPCVHRSLFLSITSTGDWATGLTLPIGQGATSLVRRNFHSYYDPRCPGPEHKGDPSCEHPDPTKVPIRGQRTYFLHSTAHLPPLFSHSLGPEDSQDIQNFKKEAIQAGRGQDVLCFEMKSLGKKGYCIVPLVDVYNQSPYWVMQMGAEFVPDHSQIFRPAFRELLQHIILERLDLQKPGTPAKPTYINAH